MRTLGIAIGSVFLLLPQSCSVEGRTLPVNTQVAEEDTLAEMISFISYIDSAHLVEDVTENYTKMEKKNEELETKLEETQQELQVVQQKLEVAEKLIEVYVPADTASSSYQLLPISKANNN